ncbi:MAG: beta-galactosidase [Chloroflexi bacterium]|nr:beta-galactosidase [Chloroflexota bacterium]
MNQFYVAGGQFWLDGRPQLIQAGEFHYFRTPPDQWAHRLGLLKTAGFNSVATYIPWLWHQAEEGLPDFDGRSHPMCNLADFLDLAADMGLWIIARPGPYIMAETINEGIPPWVFATYPQAAFINQREQVENIASYLQPDFLACVRKWYTAVFAILTPRQFTRNGRIIMVQLDNEMGMPHWVRNIFDTNPDTLARFAAYLRATYADRLPEIYPADQLPDWLGEQIIRPTEPHAARVVADYRRFYRDYLREYAAFLLAEAQANGLEVPPIINVHGFMNGGKTFPIGLSQLVQAMELPGMISATDVYPIFIGEGNFHQLLLVNETTKALQNPDQPLFSVEFQAGGHNDFSGSQSSLYDLHGRLCLSTGMRAINHYLFFDGENHPLLSPVKRHDWGHPVRKDGTLRRHYHRYPQLSRVLHAYGDDLILARPQTVTAVGFLLDQFMTEVNNAFTQEATNTLTHQREVILCDFIARGLALTHRPFTALELSRAPLDPTQTPTCWVMMEQQCPMAVQQKLIDYARQGGKLVLIGRLCVEDFDYIPCALLQDALGVTHIASDPPFSPATINAFHHEDVPVSFAQSYTGQFSEVIATRPNGAVVGFRQTVGQGQVLLLGAALTTNTLADLDVFEQIARLVACPPLLQLSEWADTRLSAGENGRFLYLNNYQEEAVTTAVAYQNAPLFDGQPLTIPPRRGLILPLEWRLNPNVLIHYLTSELTAVNDEGDTLTLHTAQPTFTAELTLTGYTCDQATIRQQTAHTQRIHLSHTNNDTIVLRR